MNVASPAFHSTRYSSRLHLGIGETGMSPGKFSDRRAVLSYRQHFAVVWQRFVRANFQSPSHVALIFQVDGSTAEKWWDGKHAPAGWVVGQAISNPETRNAAIGLLSDMT